MNTTQTLGGALIGQMVGSPVREPVSISLLRRAADLSAKAQKLAENAGVRLQPVMASEPPVCVREVDDPDTDFPPLFSELRGSLRGIDMALDAIDSLLSRVEL